MFQINRYKNINLKKLQGLERSYDKNDKKLR
jgi:hypothetical protein